MLIEFSVSNFRSFREKQTLSMVAAPRMRKRENVFAAGAVGEKLPDLLKVAVIYGPNASGKSNLLKALHVVSLIADQKPAANPALLPVSPFRFDSSLADQPSCFDLHFLRNGTRYQFEFSATPERIITERLIAFPKGREKLLYSRQYQPDGEIYTFGDSLEGTPSLHETWQITTGSRSFFITQAVANSSDALQQLRVPFQWLSGAVVSLLDGMKVMAEASQRVAREDADAAAELASFLQKVDVPVSRIKVMRAFGEPSASRTTLTHRSALGEADFLYEDESEGTKNLIGFWLPWITRGVSKTSSQCLLSVDELDSSLHPKIVAALVAKHLTQEPPSQLLFTTHDTHLMDVKLLRRDQFWITERDANGATKLRCIYEYEGRESEDIEKRYYEGRYRGLPLLRRI